MARQSALAKMKSTAVDTDRDSDAIQLDTVDAIDAPSGLDFREILIARTGLKTASKYQVDIFEHLSDVVDDYVNGEDVSALAVQAVAGSGKTTTVVAAAKLVPTNLNSIFLAFNKSIADELADRLPRHVKSRTLNSLGYSMLRPYLAGIGVTSPNLKPSRTSILMREVLSYQQQDDFGKDVKFLTNMCKALGIIAPGTPDARGVCDAEATDDQLDMIARVHDKRFDPVVRPTIYAKVRELLMLSFSDTNLYDTGTIDYDDQKWLTVCKKPDGRDLAQPQFDVIFVDEVQDVNNVDMELIKMSLKPNGIVIGVGDPKQCQPSGNRVSLVGGDTKDISEIKVGDRLVSYATKKSQFGGCSETESHNSGRVVEAVSQRQYTGNMYHVEVDGKSSSSTDNHRWLVRMNDTADTAYAVYVMERETANGVRHARVGTCRLMYDGGFGLAMRCRQENADKAWILSVFADEASARTAESIISANHGIPQMIFNYANQNSYMEMNNDQHREYVDDVWANVWDMNDRVINVLNQYKRRYEFPIWTSGSNNPHVGRYPFVTQASNLLSGVMSMRTYEGTKSGGSWVPMTVSRSFVEDVTVYSLQVQPLADAEGRRLYISNDIVTHNSIYGFRGAGIKSFDDFVKEFNAKTLPLTITYRCGTELVKHAQIKVPEIKAAPNAKAGVVETLDTYGPSTFQPQDLVLCRNNAPLIDFAFNLLRAGIPVYVKGRNIGAALIDVINQCVSKKVWIDNPRKPGKKMPSWTVDGVTTNTLLIKLEEWKTAETVAIYEDDPDNHGAVQRIEDRYETIRIFIEGNSDGMVSTLVEEIDGLFSDANRADAVICSTIHKSKGLEAERVFMYGREYMYPPYVDRGSWQYQQETNLDYVARTRGKTYYAYLRTDGWNATKVLESE